MLLGKSRAKMVNIFNLLINDACGFLLFTPIIENAFFKMCLKFERSSLHFTNLNLSLTKKRTERKENRTFEPRTKDLVSKIKMKYKKIKITLLSI